jgi:Kdo2-lipid IVA lauroyltransferase/acyltransferase
MPFLQRLRYGIEFVGFLLLAAAIRALPVDAASRWSGASWRLFAPYLRRHQRAIANLTMAFPEKSPAEIRQIAMGMWDNLGRTFAEFFHLDEIVNSDRMQIETSETLETIKKREGGMVACSLHMGNWEIASTAGVPLGLRPAGVYQRIHNPFVERYVNAIRAPFYPGGLMQKESPQAARVLLRYAQAGGCTTLLADQRDPRGIATPFFGKLAPSTPFPASVARSAKTPLYVFRVKRAKGARFLVRAEEVPIPRTADRKADIVTATRDLQATFEGMIREAPEQWMWIHGRWI